MSWPSGVIASSPIPALTRTVLLLRFREHQQCKDIARQLTERQVRHHLRAGFERLCDALRD